MKMATRISRLLAITVAVMMLQSWFVDVLAQTFWHGVDYAREFLRDDLGVERWVRNGLFAIAYAVAMAIWLGSIAIAIQIISMVFCFLEEHR